ncbi:hypothetical protein D3C72_2293170 [compost metagenome]
MDDHQLVVRRQVQVEFAALDPMLEAVAKTVQGIFRGFALGTAVAVDKGHVCSFKKVSGSAAGAGFRYWLGCRVPGRCAAVVLASAEYSGPAVAAGHR